MPEMIASRAMYVYPKNCSLGSKLFLSDLDVSLKFGRTPVTPVLELPVQSWLVLVTDAFPVLMKHRNVWLEVQFLNSSARHVFCTPLCSNVC
jgi:hypothetical protein